MTTVTRTNPTPYIEITGHCYADFGYPRPGAPQNWQTLGGPERLCVGAVYQFTGRFHRSRPVIYLKDKPDALLSGSYRLLTNEEFAACDPALLVPYDAASTAMVNPS